MASTCFCLGCHCFREIPFLNRCRCETRVIWQKVFLPLSFFNSIHSKESQNIDVDIPTLLEYIKDPIQLTPFRRPPVVLSCGHMFSLIDESDYIYSKCPICRQDMCESYIVDRIHWYMLMNMLWRKIISIQQQHSLKLIINEINSLNPCNTDVTKVVLDNHLHTPYNQIVQILRSLFPQKETKSDMKWVTKEENRSMLNIHTDEDIGARISRATMDFRNIILNILKNFPKTIHVFGGYVRRKLVQQYHDYNCVFPTDSDLDIFVESIDTRDELIYWLGKRNDLLLTSHCPSDYVHILQKQTICIGLKNQLFGPSIRIKLDIVVIEESSDSSVCFDFDVNSIYEKIDTKAHQPISFIRYHQNIYVDLVLLISKMNCNMIILAQRKFADIDRIYRLCQQPSPLKIPPEKLLLYSTTGKLSVEEYDKLYRDYKEHIRYFYRKYIHRVCTYRVTKMILDGWSIQNVHVHFTIKEKTVFVTLPCNYQFRLLKAEIKISKPILFITCPDCDVDYIFYQYK